MTAAPAARLTDILDDVLPVYDIPTDDLVGDILVPGMTAARRVRIGSGFFSSEALAQIAPGLAAFITHSNEPLELLISPSVSDDDLHAIERGLAQADEVVSQCTSRLLDGAALSTSAVVAHTLDCLAYLVATGRLDLRVVLMKEGIYHKKIWLLEDDVWCAVHGSSNVTKSGLLVNGEQMTVDRPWADGPAAGLRVQLLLQQWEKYWDNRYPGALTLQAPDALRFLAGHSDTAPPTVEDFWTAWCDDYTNGLAPALPAGYQGPRPLHLLRIPPDMNWQSGRYRHQGAAVTRYLEADGRGTIEMATGGGKTKTALIAATHLQDRRRGAMLVVILVPSTPLMLQWADDVRDFGVEPTLPSQLNQNRRASRYEEIRAALTGTKPRTEVMIVTNKLFSSDHALRDLISSLGPLAAATLIGDEMHNLGVPTFLNNLPERFDYRLGLSATPLRQYDAEGTAALLDFFGSTVFAFDLQQAIDVGCLTPYRYHLHPVALADDEMDKYTELTEELRSAGFYFSNDDASPATNPKIERLLRERRAVLEQASAKITVLRELLLESGPRTIGRTLIYTSGKATVLASERQIETVNRMLQELGVVAHAYTGVETAKASSRTLLDQFGSGDYQVLTAMKVLDEGVDIPQTDTAYILASSTVRREWVQRRGRILRQFPGKQIATLHDFLVVPPDPNCAPGQAVLRGELARAEEFASLAENEWDNDGPRAAMAPYDDAISQGGFS